MPIWEKYGIIILNDLLKLFGLQRRAQLDKINFLVVLLKEKNIHVFTVVLHQRG